MNDGSRSMLSKRHIGHFVKEGDSGLTVSGDDLSLLLLGPFNPQDEFFLVLLVDGSLADLLRLDLFSSCLRSISSLLLSVLLLLV